MNLKWKPSRDEGYTETHCGRWQISPVYWGRVKATGYRVSFEGKRIGSEHATQRDAKAWAQGIEDSGRAAQMKADAIAWRGHNGRAVIL